MKWMKAIGVGILIWILIFVEISITMIGLKLPDLYVWLIHYIFLMFIVILGVNIHYKKKDSVNGFVLGFVLLIVGIVLDLSITIPFFVKDYAGYFSNIYMLMGFVELIVIAGIYDIARKKR